jgi:hypothetical protein
MPRVSEQSKYRIIWLVGSLIPLISLFLPYVYGDTLISAIQLNLSKMFNVFGEPTWENFASTISVIGFMLVVLGGAICLIFSLVAYEGSRIWNAPKGIRVWNAAILGLIGVILLSLPVFIYENGSLVKVQSVTGIQYWPNFEGLGMGYYITWIGVLMSLVSGDLVLKHGPASEPPKKT